MAHQDVFLWQLARWHLATLHRDGSNTVLTRHIASVSSVGGLDVSEPRWAGGRMGGGGEVGGGGPPGCASGRETKLLGLYRGS